MKKVARTWAEGAILGKDDGIHVKCDETGGVTVSATYLPRGNTVYLDAEHSVYLTFDEIADLHEYAVKMRKLRRRK